MLFLGKNGQNNKLALLRLVFVGRYYFCWGTENPNWNNVMVTNPYNFGNDSYRLMAIPPWSVKQVRIHARHEFWTIVAHCWFVPVFLRVWHRRPLIAPVQAHRPRSAARRSVARPGAPASPLAPPSTFAEKYRNQNDFNNLGQML